MARRPRSQRSDSTRSGAPGDGDVAVAPEIATIEIERLAAGGDGVGRLPDGCAIFVPFAAPGDRLRVRIVEHKGRHARGEILEIERAGPARRPARCGVFGLCGGCAWQHLDYAAQQGAKRAILVDALERIGGLSLPGEVAFRGSPDEFGYRTRARMVAASGQVGFRRAHSHELQPIDACPVLAPELEAGLGEAARIGTDCGRPVEVELCAGVDGSLRVALCDDDAPPEAVELAVAGDRLRVSAGVFSQANSSLIEALHAAVMRGAGEGERVAELFAGAGLFTLALARRFERVFAVEANARATADLRHNLGAIGVRAEVSTRPVGRAWRSIRAFAPQVVVLDPPRSGLDRHCRRQLGDIGAERIVYASCDPATLARDLQALCASGYELLHVEGFDLFPQTHHVEAVAVLAAGGGRPRA